MDPHTRAQGRSVSAEEIRTLLISEVASILEVEQPDIDPSKAFDEYGLDSVGAVVLLNVVEELIGTELEPELVMRQRCIDDIVHTLAGMELVSAAAV